LEKKNSNIKSNQKLISASNLKINTVQIITERRNAAALSSTVTGENNQKFKKQEDSLNLDNNTKVNA